MSQCTPSMVKRIEKKKNIALKGYKHLVYNSQWHLPCMWNQIESILHSINFRLPLPHFVKMAGNFLLDLL
jgi:hypothetical protein